MSTVCCTPTLNSNLNRGHSVSSLCSFGKAIPQSSTPSSPVSKSWSLSTTRAPEKTLPPAMALQPKSTTQAPAKTSPLSVALQPLSTASGPSPTALHFAPRDTLISHSSYNLHCGPALQLPPEPSPTTPGLHTIQISPNRRHSDTSLESPLQQIYKDRPDEVFALPNHANAAHCSFKLTLTDISDARELGNSMNKELVVGNDDQKTEEIAVAAGGKKPLREFITMLPRTSMGSQPLSTGSQPSSTELQTSSMSLQPSSMMLQPSTVLQPSTAFASRGPHIPCSIPDLHFGLASPLPSIPLPHSFANKISRPSTHLSPKLQPKPSQRRPNAQSKHLRASPVRAAPTAKGQGCTLLTTNTYTPFKDCLGKVLVQPNHNSSAMKRGNSKGKAEVNGQYMKGIEVAAESEEVKVPYALPHPVQLTTIQGSANGELVMAPAKTLPPSTSLWFTSTTSWYTLTTPYIPSNNTPIPPHDIYQVLAPFHQHSSSLSPCAQHATSTITQHPSILAPLCLSPQNVNVHPYRLVSVNS